MSKKTKHKKYPLIKWFSGKTTAHKHQQNTKSACWSVLAIVVRVLCMAGVGFAPLSAAALTFTAPVCSSGNAYCAVSMGGTDGSTATMGGDGLPGSAIPLSVYPNSSNLVGTISGQSSGGGGGSLYYNVTSQGGSYSIYGGMGGAGGAVTITNTNPIPYDGIIGISQGGGGGDANFGGGNVYDVHANIVGGNGGNAGNVTITSDSSNSYKINPGYVFNTNASVGIAALSQGGNAGYAYLYESYNYVTETNGTPGNGGNVSVSFSGLITLPNTNNNIGAFAQSVGGTGTPTTAGGSAGTVSVTLASGSTISNASNGIIAQSIGGAAGTENFTDSIATGSAGSSGTVTVTNAATFTTSGAYGAGIIAQSVGGGGGTVALDNSSSYAVSNAYGLGNSVTVTQAGSTIATTGADAPGIVAQGLGDGGGLFSTVTGNTALTIGSNGSGGNNGGTVAVNLGSSGTAGAITTQGATAFGILAQSIAGGGGSAGGGGGIAYTGSQGASGGAGQSVGVTTTGNSSINTSGDGAIAIVAQSIGGGGGNGGSSRGWAAAVGGSGGSGGTGGTVAVAIGTGSSDAGSGLTTSGDYASIVLAQSIGGGGGNGGYAKSTGLFASAAIGGSGGAGGTGGAVTIENYGTLAAGGAQSHGIVAQSISGGGGNGGAALSYSAGAFFSSSTALGGSGGGGGTAGTVTVSNASGSSISTAGLDAMGILAQSVSGGGGSGGAASSKAQALGGSVDGVPIPSFSESVSLGGSGGIGGQSGAVNVANSGTILTTGDGGDAILAQSIGGGGGNGGDSSANAVSGALPNNPVVDPASSKIAFNFGYSSGGSGGSGGAGSTVTVNNTGAITTWGNSANGIVAQSIGGGGGNGSPGNATTQSDSSVANLDMSLAMGGNGGTGATGGNVTVNYQNCISTGIGNTGSTAAGCTVSGSSSADSSAARGIVAQSIGGGGGLAAGGTAGAQGYGIKSGTVTSSVALGGAGGSGGNGGTVSVQPVSNLNGIITTGGYSDAILAQSIGGGGGAAGNADATASSDAAAQIVTSAAGYTQYASYGFTMSHSLGGGAGGDGGSVTVGNGNSSTATTSLLINAATSGVWSDGILAQSIGGGGGSSGTAASKGALGSLSLNLQFGGSGGTGGTGGAVTVQGIGTVITSGYGSMGIAAQSIGGGGGAAVDGSGFSVLTETVNIASAQNGVAGAGGSVSASIGQATSLFLTSNPASVSTSGLAAYGVLAQSVGGGGGLAGLGDGLSSGSNIPYINVGLGGNSSSGSGGTVEAYISQGSSVSTSGVLAHGVVAQSIGGGGGVLVAATPSSPQQGMSISASLGGTNGASGNAGAVNVVNYGSVSTSGALAMGVVAQSIGGGGGLITGASNNFVGTLLGGSTVFASNSKNPPDPGGAGGNVAVIVANSVNGYTASIFTRGAGAYGVLAQSIGGGGGFIGDPSQSWSGVSAPAAPGSILAVNGTYGNAGTVGVTVSPGTGIFTTGSNAHGIVAQSVGGGGGIISLAGGSVVGSANSYTRNSTVGSYSGAGNTITVNVNGTVSATGAGSYGIFAESDGVSRGAANITIGNGGAVYGNAAGVMIQNSDSSNVTVASGGILAGGCTGASTADCNANNGYALLASNASAALNNSGTVVGSLDPATNSVIFNNYGTYYAGSAITHINMNDYGTTFLSQHAGQYSSVVMTGTNYSYAPSARLAVNADFAHGYSDTLTLLNGSTFNSLAATPAPLNVLLNTGNSLMPGKVAVLNSSPDSSINSSPSLQVVNNSIVTSFPVLQNSSASGTAYSIASNANFTPTSVALSANQQSIAHGLQSAWNNPLSPGYNALTSNGQSWTLGNVFYQFNGATAANYNSMLNTLASNASTLQAQRSTENGISAASDVMSCPGFAGADSLLQERECAWIKAIGKTLNMNSQGTDANGYSGNQVGFTLGGQKELIKDWFAGASIVYDNASINFSNVTESSSITDLAGALSLKHQAGPLQLATSLAYGHNWSNNTRVFQLGTLGATAKSAPEGNYLAGQVRGSYQFQIDNTWYVRPILDVGVLDLTRQSYAENGGGALSLQVSGLSQSMFYVAPSLDLGMRWDLDYGFVARPFVNAGYTKLTSPLITANSQLVSTQGSASFQTSAPTLDNLARFSIGADILKDNNFEFKVLYLLDANGSYTSQGGSLKLGYYF
jgi:hypothetical protein